MKAIVWIIGLIVLVVILAGGWYLLGNKDDLYEMESLDDDMEYSDEIVDLLDSPGPLPVGSLPIGDEIPAVALEEVVDIEEAVLDAVGTYTGFGTATRSFDGSTFSHTVTANIGDPADGKFYEGWLVMPTASGPQFFSTGKLVKTGSVYGLQFNAPENYPDHINVVITEETTSLGLDNKPEAHVLEGSF